MPTTNIYALCEPGTLTVRYVGKTQHTIKARLKEHVVTAKAYNHTPIHEWINSLDKAPDIVLLTTCPDDLVREVEKNWILLFIDNGYDMLNIRDCDKRGKKSKRKVNLCDDPVYFRALVDRLIAEEAEMVAAGLQSPFGKWNRDTEAQP